MLSQCRSVALHGRREPVGLTRGSVSSELRRLLLACLLIFTVLLPGASLAQTFYASVSGLVTDESHAVVSGADVTVIETTTSVEYKTSTNQRGSYRVSFLKPGAYVVRVKKDGYQEYKTSAIQLVLNQEARVDAMLSIGMASQVVNVSAEGTALNDANPQISTQFGSDDLINVPQAMVGSNGSSQEFLLAAQVPGAAGSSSDYSNPNNISLGGGRPDTNPIIIDGLPSNMGVDGTYGLVPTPDSTEELQVLTSPFSAQYGQSGGGAILTTTKSGTQNFHGSLFEYHNDQSMNALQYFDAPNTGRPVNVYNYFGGSLGGPVRIPWLFNGLKHHLFFFTDWEDTINNSANTLNTNVPTAAERNGDFSGPDPQGQPTPTIYDPRTLKVVNGVITGTPFAGNIIPADRMDSVGKNLLAYYPRPNCSYLTYNYCVNPPSHNTYLYNADRIDFNATDYDHIWAKFSRDGPTTGAVSYIPNAANTSAANGWKDDHYETSWSHIFGPRVSNEARFGYVSEVNFSDVYPVDSSSIGLKGVTLNGFPNLSVNGLYDLGPGSYQYTLDGHYILNDAMVLQIGRHSLSIGGEFMNYHFSEYDPGVLSGEYDFSGQFTSISGQPVTGIADLELGLPDSTTIDTNNTWFRETSKYGSLYVQDDYRVLEKLTINLGLRWEFDGPFTETRDQMYTFNPNLIDTNTGAQGAIEFAGYNGAPHALIGHTYLGFLPRIGFSYHALKNTVVRGGYGIYELPGIGFAMTATTSKTTVNTTFQSPDGITAPYQLDDGVPPYSPQVDANGEPSIPTSLSDPSSNVVELQRDGRLAYIQQWQLGIQQDLGGGWLGEIDYQGNHGVHMPIQLPRNQIAPSPGCCYGNSAAQSLRPYPQFLNVTYYVNGGASNYNALLAQLTHRWKNGLSVLAAYTYAKQMNDVDPSARGNGVGIQNAYDLHAQWGTAMTDIPQRFSLTAVWNLPIGASGRFLRSTPVLSQALGHWRVSTIAAFQVGYPYHVSQSNTLGIFSNAQYVTRVGNPEISRGKRTIEHWFNTDAFAITPNNILGNGARASLFGPGQNVWNIGLMRDVPVREKFTFTFRADAYNAFNHPQFNGLGTSITSGNFGQITKAQDARTLQVSGRIRF